MSGVTVADSKKPVSNVLPGLLSEDFSVLCSRIDGVCQIVLPNHVHKTGFLIGKGLLLTNSHVLPDRQTATKSYARFFYEKGKTPVNVDFNCDAKDGFFYSSAGDKQLEENHLDFTIIALKFHPALSDIYKHYMSIFSNSIPKKGAFANTILHPSSNEFKRVAFRDNKVTKVLKRSFIIHYQTTTSGDFSGSPVIDDHGYPIALYRQKCSEHENCNIAILTHAIAQEIIKKGLRNKIEHWTSSPIPEKLVKESTAKNIPGRPTEDFSTLSSRIDAVCQIIAPHNKPGTGFLIGDGLLLTNNHVLPDLDTARRSCARFFYEKGKKPVKVDFNCDPDEGFFYTSSALDEKGSMRLKENHLDFTIVSLKPHPALVDTYHRTMSIFNEALPIKGYSANIIQHPSKQSGDLKGYLSETDLKPYKRIVFRDNKITEVDKNRFVVHYHTATRGGSSGSPVLNDQGKLVGLHRANCGIHENCNLAILTYSIAQHIMKQGLKDKIETWVCPRPVEEAIEEPSVDDPLPPSIDFFTGRAMELQKLEEVFQAKGVVVAPPITGPGGIGKSQLVLKLINKLQDKQTYDHVIWISAKTKESIINSYLYMANALEIGKGEKASVRVDLTKNYLQKKHCLYVYDDAPDIKSINKHFPKKQRCKESHILITSRNSYPRDWHTAPLDLSPFTPLEALELAKNFGRGKDDPDYVASLEKIFDLFPRYPLALVQLLSILEDEDPEDLIEELKKDSELFGLLKEDPNGDVGYDKAMTFVVKTNLEKIRKNKQGRKAINLLRLIAYLDNSRIPLNWVLTFDPEDQSKRKRDVKAALALLEKSSFIQWVRKDKLLHTHAVLQTIVRQLHPQESLSFLVRSLTDYLGDSDEAFKNLKKWESLLPHGRFLYKHLSSEKPQEEHSTLSYSLSQMSDKTCLYDESFKWAQTNLEIVLQLHKDDHLDIADSYNNLGIVYDSQGKYNQAEEAFKKSLEMRERLFKGDHLDIASSYNNLGMVYNAQGKYNQAEKAHKKSLEMRERLFNGDHPDIASSYNNLGMVYNAQGKYNQAEEAYNKSLEMMERLFKGDHPRIAASYNNLGNVYDSQGKYNQAEEAHKKSLEMRERLFNGDHPSIATSYNNLGSVYDSQGKYNQAEEAYKKSLEMEERLFEGDHPAIAASYNNLGIFCTPVLIDCISPESNRQSPNYCRRQR